MCEGLRLHEESVNVRSAAPAELHAGSRSVWIDPGRTRDRIKWQPGRPRARTNPIVFLDLEVLVERASANRFLLAAGVAASGAFGTLRAQTPPAPTQAAQPAQSGGKMTKDDLTSFAKVQIAI